MCFTKRGQGRKRRFNGTGTSKQRVRQRVVNTQYLLNEEISMRNLDGYCSVLVQ